MSLFATAAELIRDTLLDTEVGGVSVTYARSGSSSLTITGMRGQSPFRTTDAEGRSILVVSDRDYLVDSTEITYGDPQKGDRITDGSEVYELWPVVPGEPCWRTCEPGGVMLRLHCRRVS